MAERILRADLDAGPAGDRFVVESAGTSGLEGCPMDPAALDVLSAQGLDGSDFRARALTAAHVATADLVLGATREHRAAAVRLDPTAVRRTFTLREFARLVAQVDPATIAEHDPVARARAVVAAAAERRGPAPGARPHDDDVADPYRASATVFTACADLVGRALRDALVVLGAPSATSPPPLR